MGKADRKSPDKNAPSTPSCKFCGGTHRFGRQQSTAWGVKRLSMKKKTTSPSVASLKEEARCTLRRIRRNLE